MTKAEAALLKVIKAWEALPGGRNYTATEIGPWLEHKMGPAINGARRAMKLPVPKPNRLLQWNE